MNVFLTQIGQVVISIKTMIVNLTKNEIKHLVYLLGKGDEDYPELNNNLLNKLQPLIDACTCKLQGEN